MNNPAPSRSRLEELAAQTTWTMDEIREFETLFASGLGLPFWDTLTKIRPKTIEGK